MKLLMTLTLLLLAIAPVRAADVPWYEGFQSNQPAAPPGLPEEARTALREAIASLMQTHVPWDPRPKGEPIQDFTARRAETEALKAEKDRRNRAFVEAIDRLPDLIPPGYRADEGRGIEEKLIAIARHKRAHSEVYESIQRNILYKRSRIDFEHGIMPREGPTAPSPTQDMLTEDYRLAWEFYALTPTAPPPPPDTKPSPYLPLPGWQGRVRSALHNHYSDARVIPTFLAFYENELGGEAISMFSQRRPEFFIALLECQWIQDHGNRPWARGSEVVGGEQPDAAPKANILEMRRERLEKAARRDTRPDPKDKYAKPVPYEETDFAKWKAFVESVPRGSIPPKLLPYYDEHFKRLRETVIVPGQ